MTPNELSAVLRARPFRPFRIVCLDGVNYEVRHPDMVLVGTGAAHLGYPDPDDPRVAIRVDIVGIRIIARIEFLEQPAAAG
jgi:hypothetical protein